MKASRLVFVLCVCLFALAGVGYSSPLTFTGTLSGANENPATNSPGTGPVLVTFDPLTDLLTINASFSGLESGTTMAHIHCCVAPNGNTGVAVVTPSLPGFPLGVTSGTYSQSLDLTLLSNFNAAFVTANGGTVAGADAAFAAGLEHGMAYFNIHTTNFPGGAVRAFLSPVPEPVSGTLLAGALGMLWLMRRRRS